MIALCIMQLLQKIPNERRPEEIEYEMEELWAVCCARVHTDSRTTLPQRGEYPQEEYMATHVLALHPAENTLYKMQEATFFCPLQAHFPEQKLEVLQFDSLNVKNNNGVFPPLNKFFP